jgi:hypothetical protein
MEASAFGIRKRSDARECGLASCDPRGDDLFLGRRGQAGDFVGAMVAAKPNNLTPFGRIGDICRDLGLIASQTRFAYDCSAANRHSELGSRAIAGAFMRRAIGGGRVALDTNLFMVTIIPATV